MAALPLLLHVLERYPDEALDALDAAPMDPDDFLLVLDAWAAEGEGSASCGSPCRCSPRTDGCHGTPRRCWRSCSKPGRGAFGTRRSSPSSGSWPARVTRTSPSSRPRSGCASGTRTTPKAAWTLFARELERFGEEPSLAALEVDLLVGEGRGDEAVAAAERWRSRLLAHAHDPAHDPALIEFADELLARASWIDPELALERACEEDDVLDRLVTLLDETPPGPVAGTHAPPAPSNEAASGRALVLAPTPAMAHAERNWHERFAGFDGLTEIVAYLDDAPLALSSFAVIESLATSLDAWAEESWAEGGVRAPARTRRDAALPPRLARARVRDLRGPAGLGRDGLGDRPGDLLAPPGEPGGARPAVGPGRLVPAISPTRAEGSERRVATLGRALDGLDPRGG